MTTSMAQRMRLRWKLGPIPLENDLIEVKVDRLPGQGNLVLTVGGNLATLLRLRQNNTHPAHGRYFGSAEFHQQYGYGFRQMGQFQSWHGHAESS